MTIRQLKNLCTTWQERLKITDWTVDISWVTRKEMPESYGETEYDPRQMLAVVRIRDDEDQNYPDGGFEQTVIHELLHIVWHGDKEYKRENIMQERAINQIADALYWAYHPRKRKK